MTALSQLLARLRRRPLPDDIAGAVRANPERVALDAAGRWWV